MLPIVYTPVVGAACEKFSWVYRRARGGFISWPDRERIDDILHDIPRHYIKVIVVTDGERILGLGDQGVGGMGIPIGKLSLYTVCGGINPAHTLPVMLDVGTNNPRLLDDPRYMGWRHPCITEEDYFVFIGMFIAAVKRRWPDVLLQLKQWEPLNVYCSNGWVEIDNNIAENALRGVAVGRKNWLCVSRRRTHVETMKMAA